MEIGDAWGILEDELEGALDPAEWSDELCDAWDTLGAFVKRELAREEGA